MYVENWVDNIFILYMKIILLFYEVTDKYINKSEINNVLDNRKNKKM
jgi:hypothetical protein